MVLGALVAYVTVRTRWRGRSLVDALAWLPWMMPGIVLGLGFLWAYALLPGFVPIYGTVWALLLAYLALHARVRAGDVGLLRAALAHQGLRAHPWRQLLADLVGASLVALSWPAFAVGWVLTFFGIMRELSALDPALLGGSEVLSVVLLKLWINGQAGQVSVIGLLMMLLVIFFPRGAASRMRGPPGPV